MATKPKTTTKTTPSKPSKKPPAVAAKLLPVTMLKLTLIDPSPINRDAAVALDSLVDSIRLYGVQQPIKVRPRPEGRYEIVYGERRWRACQQLGLAEIPALVEELTDDEAQARRVLENTQRADPHALEEAEAYERLLAMKNDKGQAIHTPESVALVAGRSVGHIYNRMRLTALAPVFRKAFYAGEISTGVAFLIARHIPTHLHDEAAERLKEFREECDEFSGYLDDSGHLTALALKEFIGEHYDARLDVAPFSMKDAKLLPSAGSCAACSKRSGNQPQLFDFSSNGDHKDRCGDMTCYQAKLTAHIERQKEQVLSIGGRVLTAEESKKIFCGGAQLPWNSSWLDLDARCYEAPEQPTWRSLLGDLCPAPVLGFTSQHRPVLLTDKNAALAILAKAGRDPASLREKAAAAGSKKKAPSTKPPPDPRDAHLGDEDTEEEPEDDLEAADNAYDADQRRRAALPDDHPDSLARGKVTDPNEARHQTQITNLARQRVLAAIVAAAETAAPDDNRFTQLVLTSMLDGGYHNAITDVVKRRGTSRPKGESPSVTLKHHTGGLTPHQLRALVLELALARDGYFVHTLDRYSRHMTTAIGLYSIDGEAIYATAKKELDEKRAGRKKLKTSAT